MSTDSRNINPGDIFWALRGENFDGNQFAVASLEKGAAYAVVDPDSDAARVDDSRIIVAQDGTLHTLWNLAAYHREHTLHNGARIPMLALTGTNGKTTTKELIKAVLRTKYNLCATEGNLNNNLGVPRTVLGLKPENDFALVEMGASHPGDINELVVIAHPDFGLITNVGRAHLLGFGSFEGVCRTKGEMYDYIASVGGKVFVNMDNPFLPKMVAERKGLETIPYGATLSRARLLPTNAENPFLGMEVTLDGVKYTIKTSLVGSYNADNVLTALAVGMYFGVPAQSAVEAIEAYVPQNNRSQMQKTERNTLIVDAYNANPSSMAAALDNFALVEAPKKVACLGDMLELGAESLAEHCKVLERVREINPSVVVLVGAEFAAACRKLGLDAAESDKGVAAAQYRLFATSDEAAAFLAQQNLSGCVALVKGSRGTRMEKVIPVL